MDGTKQELRRFMEDVFREQVPSARSRDRKAIIAEMIRNRKQRVPQELARLLKELDRHLDHDIGILCFSAKADDILMWGHYADAHSGICLRFSTEISDSPFASARAVKYQREYPSFSILTGEHQGMTDIAVRTKAQAWEYEQEWRMIDHTSGPGTKQFKPELLTGVIFGARISPKDRADVTAWAKRHITPVELYEARLAKHEYGIEIVPLV